MEDDCLLKKVEKQENVARQFGFYWENIEQLIDQIRSECQEIHEAWEKKDQIHLQEEVGDLLLAAVSLAVFCNLDPHQTLKQSIDKFQNRYDKLVKLVMEDGRQHLHKQSFETLMHYWDRAKQ